MSGARVCAGCARRTWLLGRLTGHLEPVRARIGELLELGDDELLESVGGAERDTIRREAEALFPADFENRISADASAHGVRRTMTACPTNAVCRCHSSYPAALLDLDAPPAVLHLTAGTERLRALLAAPAVAVVGARAASAYGRETAHALAGGLAAAELTVVSGMALGIDAAAHAGALGAGSLQGTDAEMARTIAVLPGGVDIAYPATHRVLHARIRDRALAVSELPPGTRPRRWMFAARNRIIAALCEMTVLVQASERSGALLTVGCATRLGRLVGAVPGPVTSSLSAGPHGLLREGAALVAGPQDVLDAIYGAGAVSVAGRQRAALAPELARLLEAISDGEPAEEAFARAGLSGTDGAAALASLELDGLLRRGPGGRWLVPP